MSLLNHHTFHIPTMGIGYTLDTPIKIAKYGITSVVSLVQDDVIEKARKFYADKFGRKYEEITAKVLNYRSKRITAYLDMSLEIVNEQLEKLKMSKEEVEKYFTLLPTHSELRDKYLSYKVQNPDYKLADIKHLTDEITAGGIDVNLMSKVDRDDPKGINLSEACAGLEGFANSKVKASVVISAGLNPRLFSFVEGFEAFYPNKQGEIEKQIILKVSDYRSALLQGKVLAKKGLWVSEYRIESGLNCGGHAFATNGFLLGPILAEFKNNKQDTVEELFSLYQNALAEKGKSIENAPVQRVTAQGGVGTVGEHEMLLDLYQLEATGWGTPFLLVPEATTIDEETLNLLMKAKEKDLYVSNSSPLGVKYNNIRGNSASNLRLKRIEEGKPGSPCFRKHLALNNEYDGESLCTASRKFQKRKIQELDAERTEIEEEIYQTRFDSITEKECICDGLAVSLLREMDAESKANNPGVSICPGPNLAYYSSTYSLNEMVGHIYGRFNIVEGERPNLFVKELGLYVEHFQKEIKGLKLEFNKRKERELKKFKTNLLAGIEYYESIAKLLPKYAVDSEVVFKKALAKFKNEITTVEV